MNRFFCVLLKKFKLNKLLYSLLKNCGKHEIISNAEKDEADKFLNSLNFDPHNSALCDNIVSENPKYDLQIIVPAYNVESYISQCLDSIFQQETHFSYLVVVVNDGSSDKTAEILQQYEDRGNIQVIHQENKGFSGARNRGLKKLCAKYVMFVDSDDYLYPNAIESLLTKAFASDVDIVEGSYSQNLNGHVIKRRTHNNQKGKEIKLFGFAWGKVIKSSLLEHICFPEGYWFEDTIFNLMVHDLAKNVETTSELVYNYRTNFKGISRNFRGKTKVTDSFFITRQLLEDRKQLNLPFDERFLQKAVKQFLFDAERISSLSREDVNKAVFVLQSSLLTEYFSNVKLTDNDIYTALLTRDYSLYKLQTSLL